MPQRAAKAKSRKAQDRNWVRIAKARAGRKYSQTREARNGEGTPPMGDSPSRSQGGPSASSDVKRANDPHHALHRHRKGEKSRLAASASLSRLPLYCVLMFLNANCHSHRHPAMV